MKMTDLQFTHLIIRLLVLFIVSIRASSNTDCESYCNTKDIEDKLQPLDVDLQNFSSILSHMQADYYKQNFESFSERAQSLLRGTDVIDQVEVVLHNHPCAKSNFTVTLNSISVDLLNFHNTIHSSKNDAFNRLSSMKRPAVKTIENSMAGMRDCPKNIEKLLQNMTSFSMLLNVVNCYEKETNVREIGNIVKSDLFEGITISKSGQFNGSDLYPTYGFIIGLYIQGCITIVTSESIKYETQRTKLKDECIDTISTANDNIKTILHECKREPCANIEFTIEDLSHTADVKEFGSMLRAFYPCFYFLILRFEKNVKPYEILIDGSPNRLTIKDDKHYQIIMWSTDKSKQTNLTSSMRAYEVEYLQDSLESIYNGLNLTTLSSTLDTHTRLLGYVPSTVNPGRCVNTVTIKKDVDDCPWIKCGDPPRYIIIAAGAVLVAIILIVICICCRKRKKKS